MQTNPTKHRPSASDPARLGVNTALTAAALAALAGIATPAAQANVVKAAWANAQTYIYEIKHMPDFDQRRVAADGVLGLPNNGGMYCVPTSAINLMAYAANHGFPAIDPGDQAWYIVNDPAKYNAITLNIFVMGLTMNTSPTDGTGGTGNKNGVTAYLNNAYPGLFTVTHQFASGYWSPKISDVTFKSLQGGISNFCYGFYDVVGSLGGAIPIVDRTGGHCVTLVKAAQSGTESQILIRDPADVPTDSVQLAFTNREWFGNDAIFARQDAPGGALFNFRTMTRLTAPGTSGMRLIDSYISFKPKFGLSYTNEEIPPKIKWVIPNPMLATPQIFPEVLNLDAMLAIDEMIQSPDLESIVVVGNIDGVKGVAIVKPGSGEFTPIELDPTLKDAVFGRFRELYVAVGQRVDCYDLDAPELKPIPFPWPFPPTSVAFSDFDDLVHTVGRFGIQTASIPARFPEGAQPLVRQLPPGLPIGAEPQILASPVDNTIWIWSDEVPTLFHLAPSAAAAAWTLINEVELDGCTPRDVALGDNGYLFLTCDGSVRELRPFKNPDGGIDWKVFEDSIFHDVPAPGGFIPELSRTNFDPEQHGIPTWENNILPEELEFGTPIVDCLGDLDGDEDVDSDDLAILLSSFGNDYLGDLDVDQDTDSDDLTILLSAFGQPCP
ncbi:MAG: hypothetical protein ACTS3F_06160 [Phycisphaerales bacterium]